MSLLTSLANPSTTLQGSLQITPSGTDTGIINAPSIQITNTSSNSIQTSGGITSYNNDIFTKPAIVPFDNLIEIENGTINNNWIGGLHCDVYEDLSGTGSFNGRLLLSTVIPSINLNGFSPLPGKSTYFSMKLTGWIKPLYTETYTIGIQSDDGARFSVNHVLLGSSYIPQGVTTISGAIALNANQWYPISIEYFNVVGPSILSLIWVSQSQSQQIVPSTSLAFSGGVTAPSFLGTTFFDGNIDLGTNSITNVGNIISNGTQTVTNTSNTSISTAGGLSTAKQLTIANVTTLPPSNNATYNLTLPSALPTNKNSLLTISSAGVEAFYVPLRAYLGVASTAPSLNLEPFVLFGKYSSSSGKATVYLTTTGTSAGTALFSSSPVITATAQPNASIGTNYYLNPTVSIDSISSDFKTVVFNTTSNGAATIALAGNTTSAVSCTLHIVAIGTSTIY